MTLRKTLMIAALGAAVTVPMALAAAGESAAQSRQGAQFSDRGPGAMFEALDLNGDGQVTRAEADQFRADRFAVLDADGDGSVSEAEFLENARAQTAERAGARFGDLDIDGDGAVSATEFEQAPRGDMFARLDQNEDGVITEDELSQRRGGPRR